MIEDEVAEAVGDEAAPPALDLLRDVRVMADDQVGAPASIAAACLLPLALARSRRAPSVPMWRETTR
jgi:hypothetical protein